MDTALLCGIEGTKELADEFYKRFDKTETMCNFSFLHNVVQRKPICIELRNPAWSPKDRRTSLQWLLDQKRGIFLVVCDNHCISVDCNKRRLYDSSHIYVLPFTKQAFQFCGCTEILADGIREVVVKAKKNSKFYN